MFDTEYELRMDMSLKLAGLKLANNCIGNMNFKKFKLCSTETVWCLQGLLDVSYPLTGWFIINSSSLSLPLRDMYSYILHSREEIDLYCKNVFRVCRLRRFKGVIEFTPLYY